MIRKEPVMEDARYILFDVVFATGSGKQWQES